MFRATKSLWEGLAKGKDDTVYEKFVNGMRLGFGWAGSGSELASHPAALVQIDERDQMEDVKGQGDPVNLAKARTATYPNGKVLITSTPTEGAVDTVTLETGLTHWDVAAGDDIQSPIWQLWQDGTRFEWAWPCPECGDYFVPRFELLVWDDKAEPEQARKSAVMACPHNGCLIEHRHKGAMNQSGVFVAPGQSVDADGAVHGDESENTIASFWVSGLASNWVSWGERAHDYVKAARTGDPGEIQSAINTGLGELYRISGDAPPWEDVRECAAGYMLGDVPEHVLMLTAGVDVQQNRLVYAVRGWGEGMSSWLIDRGEIWGETDQPGVWQSLENLLYSTYSDLGIALMLVDEGFRTNEVFDFCRRNQGHAQPAKGRANLDKPYKAANVDVNVRGKVIKRGLQHWIHDDEIGKAWVHSRIEWPDDQPGAWFLPSDIDEEYCKQIVSWQRITKPSGRTTWIQARKDDHYLDVEVLALLAARIRNADKLRKDSGGKRTAVGPRERQQTGVGSLFSRSRVGQVGDE
jgi:phage terminase large subunit GpA-like protein